MSKIQILAVAGFLALGAAAVYMNFTSESTRPSHVSTPPDMSKLEPGVPIVSVVLPKFLSSNAAMGKRAYEAVCSSCHGENTAGVMGAGPTFISRIYETSHHGDASFLSAAANGVTAHHWPFGNMPPQTDLTKAELGSIIAYVRELQRANGIN